MERMPNGGASRDRSFGGVKAPVDIPWKFIICLVLAITVICLVVAFWDTIVYVIYQIISILVVLVVLLVILKILFRRR